MVVPLRQLVVTDLDGTFWGEGETVHPATVAAVAELDRRGVELVFATGRRESGVRRGFDRLAAHGVDLFRPTLVVNGAIGIDLPGVDRFHCASFSPNDASTVLAAFSEGGHVPCGYGADGVLHVPSDTTTGAAHRLTFGSDVVHHVGSAATVFARLAESTALVGFSVIGVEASGLDRVAAALPPGSGGIDRFPDHLHGQWSLMVQPPGVSKWTGVVAHLERSTGRPSALERHAESEESATRVIAVGDGGNDLELLSGADVALKVSGGVDELDDVADAEIPHPEVGGWARVLDHLL